MDEKSNLIVDNDEGILKLVADYIQAKGDKFTIIPMEDRIKLFLALVKDSGYRKESFERIFEFKNLFFPNREIEKLGIKDLNNILSIMVVGDRYTKENKVIVLYSEKGVNNNQVMDKNNTQAFEISFKNHEVEQVSLKELKSKILCGNYAVCQCGKVEEQQEKTDDFKNLKEAFKEYLTLTNDRQA